MLPLLALFCILGLAVANGPIPIRHEDPRSRDFQHPYAFKSEAVEDVKYRLSGDVVPDHYDVTLRLEKDAFDKETFSGTVVITVIPTKDTKMIDLHYRSITIDSKELKKQGDDTVIDVTEDYNDLSQIWTLTTSDSLSKGTVYILTVTYKGILSSKSMSGFYMSSYPNGKNLENLATTQFEPAHARQAFPSFDEPGLKATFQVKIELDSDFYTADYTAMSNTDQESDEAKNEDTGYRTITFKKTPKMSTYLVAFIVSKFTCTESPILVGSDKIQTKACSRAGTENDIKVALETAPQVLNFMEQYTGFQYGDSQIGKLAQVAIPDFAAGAMENWGLVTYREADLLWREDESSASYKQTVATVVAHELSHQWFGDLVTLNWWANVFLNEGFASYFEYHVTDLIYTDWDLTKQFVVEELQNALLTDSYNSSSPLSFDVQAPTDIGNRFDAISYDKGGSILRMVHHFLGLDNFKKGLTDYIATNKLSNAQPVDLWTALSKYFQDDNISKTLPVIIDSWITQAGYPTLTVTSDDNGINITQARFLVSGTVGANTKWYVPISYTLSIDKAAIFTDTTTKAWLTPDKALELPTVLKDAKADWIILNNQQAGFYRVDYDDKLLAKILDALAEEDFSNIDEISRAQITDDLLNFARAGKKTYTDVIKNLQFLANETSYYTWYAAINGFTYLLNKIGDEKVQTAFGVYLQTLTETLYKSTSGKVLTGQVDILKQVLARTWACKLGLEDCLKTATDQFVTYREKDTKPDPNLRGVVYCNGLRNSDNASRDFEFLWGKLQDADISTETVTILRSLGCVKDTKVLQDYLARTIADDSIVRLQDGTYPFSSVYSSNPGGVDVALDFITANYKDIADHFGDSGSLATSALNAISDRLTTQAQIDKLEKFSKDNKDVAKDAVTNAQNNLKVTKSLEKDLTELLNLNAKPSSAISYQLNIVLLVVLYVIVKFN